MIRPMQRTNKRHVTQSFCVLTIVLGVVFPRWSYAQENWSESGEIEDAQVVVEKNREIELPNAARNFEKVPPGELQKESETQSYRFTEYDYGGSGYVPLVKANKVSESKSQKVHDNYVKFGFGNFISPLGQLSLNTQQNKLNAGVHFRHLSFSRGPVDGKSSGSSDNHGGVYANLIGQKSLFSAELDFSSIKRYHYGFTDFDRSVDLSPTKQRYNQLGASISLENSDVDDSFDYRITSGFYTLSDNFNAEERGFNFALNLLSPEAGGFRIFSDISVLLTKYEDGTSENRNLSKLKGGIKYNLGQLTITGAANLVLSNDTISNANDFRLYPHAIAQYQINDDWALEGGITGDLEEVTLRTISAENPFIDQSQPLFHSNKQIELYGKVRGSVSQNVGASLGISFANYENLYFYTDSLRFDIVYDTDATDVLNLFGEMNLELSNAFNLQTRIDFFSYNTKSLGEAWHRPTLTWQNDLQYKLNNDVLLAASLSIISGIEVLNPVNSSSENLDAIVDLGLQGQYRIKDPLFVFIQLDNVLNREYERFFSYPNRSFMAHLGASYSF